MKVVQESLHHANSRITLDVYTQGLMPTKRLAQGRVVKSLLARVAPCRARLLLQVLENKRRRVSSAGEGARLTGRSVSSYIYQPWIGWCNRLSAIPILGQEAYSGGETNCSHPGVAN